jgi:hypothetical protein
MSWREIRRGYTLSVLGLTVEDHMSDEGNARELTEADPHPRSQHRTPLEIVQDEAGPIGRSDSDCVLLPPHHPVDYFE